MTDRRVVITGMGSVTPFGVGNTTLKLGIENNVNPFKTIDIKVSRNKVITYPVGTIPFKEELNDLLPREVTRTMSNLSLYAYIAATEALEQANIKGCSNIGVSVSSSFPSNNICQDVFYKYYDINPKAMPSTIPLKILSNNCAFNLSTSLGLVNRCLSSSSACASGLQSIALAYENIKYGQCDMMLCGGTEEYHPFITLIFEKLGIASKDRCKPFDMNRDGIIISEGAGILFIEEYEHAINRNATILGEILGCGMNIAHNISYSDTISIVNCMLKAIQDAELCVDEVNYINAHATGTYTGDISEGKAIETLLKYSNKINVNALKGYLGHTMAACGSIETITTILGLRNNKFYSTNCKNYDKECGHIKLDKDNIIHYNPIILKNSFGLGGTNCTLIFKVYN